MAVVFDSSRTVFFKNIVSVFCHFVGSKKIEFVVIVMFESLAGFFGTFRSVHDTYGCKGCAGGDGSWNIDGSQTSCLCNSFGEIHDFAATDADNFITAGSKASVSIFFCCFKTAYTCIDVCNIIYTGCFQTREQLFFYSIKSSCSCNKECFFTESCNFLSAFFQDDNIIASAISRCSGTVSLGRRVPETPSLWETKVPAPL